MLCRRRRREGGQQPRAAAGKLQMVRRLKCA